ncbi:MAG: hypothetical protein CMJ59_21355 [Planctomycetaceae bacterium]|nr:hypothetical protein [Planctomycetaceae bacterium]
MSGMLIVTLVLAILPGTIGIAIAIGMWMLLGLLAFHYIVWGRWLSKIIRSDDSPEDSLRS